MAQITIGLKTESDVKRGMLPWSVWKNPGGPGDQPAFPCVRDGSGLPHGADIVCETLGDSDECKANARLIVEAVNSHDQLKQQRDALLSFAQRVADHYEDTDAPLGITARELIAAAKGT